VIAARWQLGTGNLELRGKLTPID